MTAKNKERFKFYKKGLTDKQIADAMGVRPDTITSWRNYYKLPVNRAYKGKVRQNMHRIKFTKIMGVPMKAALDPDQCEDMKRFLRCILIAHDANREFDITRFMKQYRDVVDITAR